MKAPKLNKCPVVVTNPTQANRRMNANVKVSMNPSPANRKLNANVVVKPK